NSLACTGEDSHVDTHSTPPFRIHDHPIAPSPTIFTSGTWNHEIPLSMSCPDPSDRPSCHLFINPDNSVGHSSKDLSRDGAMLHCDDLEVSRTPNATSLLDTVFSDTVTTRMQRQSQPCAQSTADTFTVLEFKSENEFTFNRSASPRKSSAKNYRPHSPVDISGFDISESSTSPKTHVVTAETPHHTREKPFRPDENSDRPLAIPSQQSNDLSQIPSLVALPYPSPVGSAAPPESPTERREVQRSLTPSGIKPSELDTDLSNITSPGLSPAHEQSSRKAGSDVSGPEKTSPSRPARTVSRLRRTVNSKQKGGLTTASSKGGEKGKEKPALVTPLEYALRLQSDLLTVTPKTNYLKGICIFYVGGDMQYASTRTRGRMDYIIKHGGTLVPKYDPAVVTHISLSEIPEHIPTVTWSWPNKDKKGKGKAQEVNDCEEEHAPGRKDKQGKRQGSRFPNASPSVDVNDEFQPFRRRSSREVVVGCSDVAKVLPPPPLNLSSRRRTVDLHPLTPKTTISKYYVQAKALRDAGWAVDRFRGENVPRRGFSCDQKGPQGTTCANQDVIEKLHELMKLHESKPSDHDRWRVLSYGKCIRALRNYPQRITSFSEARSIRGVGEKTALKIMEIINTGDLKRIEHERTDDGIYGVGRSTAFAWYAKARSKSLRLSPVQEIGLKTKDINSRMPREEAARIFSIIKSIALEIDNSLFIEIMGSYRRGKADCGDIDILVTRPVADGKSHAGVLPRLLDRLRAAKVLAEDLAVPADPSELELIYRGLCKLPDPGAKRRRIDILCVPWESRGAALLYYTFNRAMRLKANVMGYSLNQRGLYAGVLSSGSIIASETEEEIFQILGVPWQEPHERVRG
ncbi:hypothetical protein BKA83DRAFT_4362418, partial [Pisolithus microcarpus]